MNTVHTLQQKYEYNCQKLKKIERLNMKRNIIIINVSNYGISYLISTYLLNDK